MRYLRITTLVACTLIALLTCSTVARAHMRYFRPPSDEAVVNTYLFAANQALAGEGTDAFYGVMDPKATLTASNPSGETTAVHGLPDIQRWFSAWAKAGAGLQVTTTTVSNPMPGVVVQYAIAGNAADSTVARYAHVFVIRNSMIVSDNFITFYRAPVTSPILNHGRNHPS
jgi:hypothetical protein